MSVKAIEAEVYIKSGVEADVEIADCSVEADVEIGREVVKTVYVEPTLESLEVMANGTYEPEEGVDGYSDVVVSIPIYNEQYIIDPKLTPQTLNTSGKILYSDIVIKPITNRWTIEGIHDKTEPAGDIEIGLSSIKQKEFEDYDNITSIHFTNIDGVTLISYTFRNCSNLRTVIIEKLISIGTEAFSYCGLDELVIKDATDSTISGYISRSLGKGIVKINGKPTSLNENAFKYSSVKGLYVSWSEGEVAGAPWQASRSVIHYDTVFDDNWNVVSST